MNHLRILLVGDCRANLHVEDREGVLLSSSDELMEKVRFFPGIPERGG